MADDDGKYVKFQEGFQWAADAAKDVPKRVPIYAQLCESIPKEMGKRAACGPNVIVPNWTGERYARNPQEVMDIRLRVNPSFVEGQDPDIEALGPEFYKTYAG